MEPIRGWYTDGWTEESVTMLIGPTKTTPRSRFKLGGVVGYTCRYVSQVSTGAGSDGPKSRPSSGPFTL